MANKNEVDKRAALEQRITAVEVSYQSLDTRLDDIQVSFIKRFDEIKSQLTQVSRDFSHAQRFPVATFISACALVLAIIIALGSGYIGKPLAEVKEKQGWVLDRLWSMKFEAARNEQIMKRNKEDLHKLNTELQQKMRDRDQVMRNEIKANMAKSTDSIRHIEDIVHGLQESERDDFDKSDFRWAYENFLKEKQ